MSGRLAVLLHYRIVSGAQVKGHPQEHSLCVRVDPARGVSIATFNLHPPPLLPANPHRAIVSDTGAFL